MERSQDLALGGPELSQWLGPLQMQLATGSLGMYLLMALLAVVFLAGMTAGWCLASVCRAQHSKLPGACSTGKEQRVAPTPPVIAKRPPPELPPQHSKLPGACSPGKEQRGTPTQPKIAKKPPPELPPALKRLHDKQTQSQTTYLHVSRPLRFQPLGECEQGCWVEPGES